MRVHLVGSIGLDTVEDVFRTVGKELGPHLQRVPDGEIGGRKLWISWQYPLLRASAHLRPDPSGRVCPTNRFPLLTLAEGVAPADVHFGELGYAREARASYLDFVAARNKGELPKVGHSSLPGNNSAGCRAESPSTRTTCGTSPTLSPRKHRAPPTTIQVASVAFASAM